MILPFKAFTLKINSLYTHTRKRFWIHEVSSITKTFHMLSRNYPTFAFVFTFTKARYNLNMPNDFQS